MEPCLKHSLERNQCILITYTTQYREGGAKFLRAAETLRSEKQNEFPSAKIICNAVESKADFLSQVENVKRSDWKISEFHFIGHSGLYGIMFGTTSWPEQFSPFEWSHLYIPFTENAKAYFHACRTARWFAPFFARTFNIKTYGYFWYTTISNRKENFSWDVLRKNNPIHIISVPGKKSHGLLGSLKKYFTAPQAYPLLEFIPKDEKIDTTYDSVASLYDETFEDISVRTDELRWLRKQLQQISPKNLLDIGCGTGSFLRAIQDLVITADGVDLSEKMILHARHRSLAGSVVENLNFTHVTGPELPFAENSFDVVTSVLSFRYLDWDPIIAEVLRVLRPGGSLIVIDMVAAPLEFKNLLKFALGKFRQKITLLKNPRYREALKKMVASQDWKKMLEYNPIRSEHELKWYLQSRFPQGQIKVINYAWHSRIIAFRSSPIFQKKVEPLSFP